MTATAPDPIEDLSTADLDALALVVHGRLPGVELVDDAQDGNAEHGANTEEEMG